MPRNQLKWILISLPIYICVGIGAYLFYKPHRNVQATNAFAQLKVQEITKEFSSNAKMANAKYLSSDGNSKVLIVQGFVSNISMNQANEKVIVLKDPWAKVGVSCTFTFLTSSHIKGVKAGDTIRIKGAITAGNSYDAGLDLYNDAILVQCDIIK